MMRALSTAATGMEAQQTRLDVTANNIANVATAGFKRSRAEFQDLIYQNLRVPGALNGRGVETPTGLQVGLGTRVVDTLRVHSEGDLRQTGNPLDLAIEGDGFFPIRTPNGEVAYTRDGAFRLNSEGKIVNSDGYQLDTDIEVPPDTVSLAIGNDGLVTAIVANQTDAVELGQIELVSFPNPSGLLSSGHNLFRESGASGNPIRGIPGESNIGGISQGTLELSNVKIVEEMIDLIAGQRAYEIATRVVKAGDEMLQQTANL